ncbi:HAD-IA family hydrolase [Kribbella sp. NPDC051718]|uniref:HAD family hydrolase n=1 Tax=Kribbella sp. NPDC051718 TaxID=3155168 RepID=UPI00341D0089
MTALDAGAFDHLESRYQAVLFDLDGVLVDSQGAENIALVGLAARLGHHLTETEAHQHFNGRRLAESVGILGDLTGRPVPPDAIEYLRTTAAELLDSSLTVVPHVTSVLQKCRMPRYIVSNSPLDMIRDRLERTALNTYFDHEHFSAYDIGIWKPDPGLYVHAAKHVGVPAGDLVAIEDSEVGLRSAAGAGIDVLWFAAADSPAIVGLPHSVRLQRFSSMLDLVGRI